MFYSICSNQCPFWLSARIACVAIALTCFIEQPARAATPSDLPAAVADHHLHIQGPALTAELKRIAARNPAVFTEIDNAILKERTGPDALRVLDEAGIKQGVLLSEAYMFASPLAAADKLDVARLTREENRFDVQAALASGGRLIAFVGIDPLNGNALDELRYWAHQRGVTGIKLHLANSGFKLDSTKDLSTLAQFVAEARKAQLPLVIHVRSAQAYSKDDVDQFIDKVLPNAEGLSVQIAHAGGWGGIDEPTLKALEAYSSAIARRSPGTEHLFFDLALIVLNDKTDPAILARFVALMRQIGIGRFVMGSDWPAKYTPRAYDSLLESQLPLTTSEWRQILLNRAPYFRQDKK